MSETSRPVLGPIQWVSGVNGLGRQVDRLAPSIAEVKS
jgi:hypothetical protein